MEVTVCTFFLAYFVFDFVRLFVFLANKVDSVIVILFVNHVLLKAKEHVQDTLIRTPKKYS
jgi:hypothetical protein